MDPTLIAGIGSAGLGAVVQLMKQASQDKHDLLMSTIGALKGSSEIADSANKRGSGFGRKFAMIVVLSVGFLGLVFAAQQGLQVSQIIDRKPIIDILGLIKLGGGPKVVEATGFVIPQYMEDSIISIIFFYFGANAAKR